MKTYLIPKIKVDEYCQLVLMGSLSKEEILKIEGIVELELEEAKKIAKIGDCITVIFNGKPMPHIIEDRKENGDLVIMSIYILMHEKPNLGYDPDFLKSAKLDDGSKYDQIIEEVNKSLDF